MRCNLGQAPYFSSFSLKGPKRNQHRNIQEINIRENKSIEDKYVKCGVGGIKRKAGGSTEERRVFIRCLQGVLIPL